MENEKKYTTDIWFTAFLIFNGIEPLDFEEVTKGKRGRSRFVFDISSEKYKEMKLKFFKHDVSKMKQIMEELKDLSY